LLSFVALLSAPVGPLVCAPSVALFGAPVAWGALPCAVRTM
jgi:hypothetical protein